MLTVAKVTTKTAAGYADYLDGRSQPTALGDYYLKDGDRVEAPGRWAAGAELVGADGSAVVSGEQLRTLMQVRRPDTGQPLRRAGATGQVAAIDATFSAPKSVCAVWALADPGLRERIERAHEQAVDRALGYAREHVQMIRVRTGDQVGHARARDLVATSWRHTTARAVPGQPPDPQLHSHVLLHAAVRGDGRIVAIDSRAWLVHQREVGAAYRTELAHGLLQIGFQARPGTGRGARYFELDGVPQELIDRWSSRHHQVRHEIQARLADQEHALEQTIRHGGPDAARAKENLRRLRATGRLTPAQDRTATVMTRSAKQPLSSHADLDAHWQATGAQLGITPDRLRGLRRAEGALAQPRDSLLGRLTEFDARFTAREARAVALEHAVGRSTQEALGELGALRAAGEVVRLADGTFTTRAHRQAEAATVDTIGRRAAGRVTPVAETTVGGEIDRLDARLSEHGAGGVTGEQTAAIRLACSDRQLCVIEGQAGTGKSTVLTAVARAHQADGRRIIVTSTAALAAQRLAAELTQYGVRCEAHSTAALNAALARGQEPADGRLTVIHDEAALASTREQHDLFGRLQDSAARIIAVGDPANRRRSAPAGYGPASNTRWRPTRRARR